MRILFAAIILINSIANGQDLKKTSNATVSFISEAPLELISASSTECAGILDLSNGEFAFRVRVRSFEGFNSALQKEHFNENYLESDKYPLATFKGHFIDKVSFDEPGEHLVSVKGRFNIHGIEDEQVVKVKIVITEEGGVTFNSRFEVQLETHEISVPRIVYQKIAEVIHVSINGILN